MPKFSVIIPTNAPDKRILVDTEDFKRLNQFGWYINAGGYAARTVHLGPDPKSKGKYLSTLVYMHREVMNTPKGLSTDHRNRNRLDNRKRNLLVCNQSVNNMNTGLPKNNTSGHKGVVWSKPHSRWKAQIKFKGRNHHLGLFMTVDEAADARKKGESQIWQIQSSL